MSEPEWITTPEVLDIMCQLNAFQPGDEILVQGGKGREWIDIGSEITNRVFTVADERPFQIGDFYYDDDPSTKIEVVCERWVLCRRNIKGWRRPCR